MGRGIALAFAWAGHDVDLIDLKPRTAPEFTALAHDAQAEMAQSLYLLKELGVLDAAAVERLLARIRILDAGHAPQALGQADVIFEGVPEVLHTKALAFGEICRHARPEAIVASTTSTMLVTDLVEMVTQPQRLLNAHWLNPAYLMPLVELSPHPGTDPQVLAQMKTLLTDAGKMPVVCAPSPGFIVPRLQALVMNEAARMVEEGVASAEDLDRATRFGFGIRYAALGLLEFIDYGGNDILYYASRYLAQTVSAERYATPPIIEQMMREERNGLRSGEGFFDYRTMDQAAYRRDVLARVLALLRHYGLQQDPR
jgi:3-hydroxybutyryl-CoA dehydrogenase